MEEPFTYGRKGIGKFFRENHRAILYTLIFHLAVLIILAFVRVEGLRRDAELGVRIEFEERTIEEILEEEEIELPREWIEEVYRQRELSSNRAVNVNAEDRFSRDISTEEYVRDLLEEIEEAREQEDRERLEELQSILASADFVPSGDEPDEGKEQEYTGPTTITYEFLDDPTQRGKVSLTVPVYKCEGSGLVKVLVRVTRNGYVDRAEISGTIEGSDRECLADAALAAALTSRFGVSPEAPESHRAIISYRFIAQ